MHHPRVVAGLVACRPVLLVDHQHVCPAVSPLQRDGGGESDDAGSYHDDVSVGGVGRRGSRHRSVHLSTTQYAQLLRE